MSVIAGTSPPDPLLELLQAVDRVAKAHDETLDYLKPAKGTRLAGELEILVGVRKRWIESKRVAWSAAVKPS